MSLSQRFSRRDLLIAAAAATPLSAVKPITNTEPKTPGIKFAEYFDNVCAFVRNGVNQFAQEPNEALMRIVEEKADIPEQAAFDFRLNLVVKYGDAAWQNVSFNVDQIEGLKGIFPVKIA